jgi:hypothetical protein
MAREVAPVAVFVDDAAAHGTRGDALRARRGGREPRGSDGHVQRDEDGTRDHPMRLGIAQGPDRWGDMEPMLHHEPLSREHGRVE